MIEIRSVESTQEREPAIAATKVEHDRCGSAENRRPIEWSTLRNRLTAVLAHSA